MNDLGSKVSVVFVTLNRKDLLREAIDAVFRQTVPSQVIVMDDGSTDGTSEMVSSFYPNVVYCRTEQSLGPAYQRNKGAEKAIHDFIFFLDDDTVLQCAETFATVLHDFDWDKVGVVAIPFVNILQSREVSTSAPDKENTYVLHAFVAAAFAVRRDLFLKLGGFREEYFYMGEEGDLSLRLLEEGYYVKASTCTPAFHYQPPGRVSFKADYYGRRNDILFLYLNAPRKFLIPAMSTTIMKGVLHGIRVGRPINMLRGIIGGLEALFQENTRTKIRPSSNEVYLKFRFLKKNEPVAIND